VRIAAARREKAAVVKFLAHVRSWAHRPGFGPHMLGVFGSASHRFVPAYELAAPRQPRRTAGCLAPAGQQGSRPERGAVRAPCRCSARGRRIRSPGTTAGIRAEYSDVTHHGDDVTRWLLDGAPEFRWKVLRDLLGATEGTVERERPATRWTRWKWENKAMQLAGRRGSIGE